MRFMKILTAVLQSNGSLEFEWLTGDLRDLASSSPAGVYTVTRTYQGNRFVLLDAHLDRLKESAALEGIPFDWKPGVIMGGIHQILGHAGFDDARVRIALARSNPDRLDFGVEPVSPVPTELKARGVSAGTVHMDRRNPRAKTTEWEKKRLSALESLSQDCYEGLLTGTNAAILEGFTSNFYAVRAGKLHTAEEDILHGISRRIVFAAVSGLLPIVPKPISLAEVGSVEEAFLSSSSRGVVPIISIDDQQIASGRPGRWTLVISNAYDQWVEDNMRTIGEYMMEART